MKKTLLIAAIVAAFYVGYERTNGFRQLTTPSAPLADVGAPGSSGAIQAAFNEQKSGVQVQGEGVVSKILDDDNDGSRHQRFILTLSSGQTILVAHNVDLAPRVAMMNPVTRSPSMACTSGMKKVVLFTGPTMTPPGAINLAG